MSSARTTLPVKEHLYRAIKEASAASPDAVGMTMPDGAKILEILGKIFSVPDASTIEATAEEMDLFGMICWLMATRNPKWLSTSYATLPVGEAVSLAMPTQKLIARLVIDPQSSEQNQLLSGHNELIRWLALCLPASEKAAYPLLLALSNTSEGASVAPSHLPPAIDANAWYVLRACQDDLYNLTYEIPTILIDRPHMSYDEIEAEAVAIRLQTILDQFKLRPWQKIPVTGAPKPESLFARLITQLAINRFVQIESDMDRMVRASARIQECLVQSLIDSGHASIEQIIPNNLTSSEIDYATMASQALKPLLDESGKSLSHGLTNIIGRQVDAIIESCHLDEFAGETLNANLQMNPVATRTVAWLVLVWAHATEASVDNEDPDVHKKEVRLVSQRTSVQKKGQGMMLRRRLVSSLLVSGAMQELSIIRLRQQNHYSQSIRMACRDAIISTFKTATLDRWQSILDMFELGNLICSLPKHEPWHGLAADTTGK